jgi:long-chain acyl-CoA synthetase
MEGAALTGTAAVLAHWRRWKGAIECAGTGRTWAARELREHGGRIVGELERAGLKECDRVAIVLANTVAFPVVLMSLLELGCNPLLVYAGAQEAELNHLVKEFGVPWVVHDFTEGVSLLSQKCYRKVASLSVGDLSVSLLAPSTHKGDSSFHLSATGVVLHPTSGTYGRAEYCIRNQDAAIAEGQNYVDTIGLYDKCRVVFTTPLSHAYAYGFGLISSILTDSTLVLDTAFNPKRILRREKEAPSDILAIVPPMAKALVRVGSLDPSRGIPKAVFYAGAPCADGLAREFEAAFDTTLFSIYGTTETGAITSSYRAGGERLPGTGTPLKTVAVEMRNCDGYADLGGGVGEIWVKSTSMMQGYVREVPGAEVGGYWSTGDIGFMDGCGNVTIVGRTKDVINLGGMKVDPSEVEKVLLDHPSVEDAAVYAGLRRDGDEFVQAAVQVRGRGIDAAELKSYCARMLTAYKVPAVFHFVEGVPRSPSGKCLKVRCPGFPKHLLTR